MTCKTTLVVEYDQNNRKVSWDFKCEGSCPDSGRECKSVRHGPVRLPGGGERWTHECACHQDGDGDPPSGECKLVVFEYIMTVDGETVTKWKGRCLGHCPHTTTPCRPLLVKEIKVAGTDEDGGFDLDQTSIHTIRHYQCVCADLIV
jgi:hypothetical protein